MTPRWAAKVDRNQAEIDDKYVTVDAAHGPVYVFENEID
jgi:hypothetical protein